MERIFHKKSELLNFVFKNKEGDFIASSNIYGQNFFYLINENKVIISIDLKNSIDINEFEFFFKDLNYIKLDNEHIIKQVARIKELNQNSSYILDLYLKNKVLRKYSLSFSLDKIGLSLKTKYIEA